MFSNCQYYCRHKTNRKCSNPPKAVVRFTHANVFPFRKVSDPPRRLFLCLKNGEPEMLIRNASMKDVNAVAAVEAECFPEAEAATAAEFEDRIRHYGNHFWLLFDGDRLVSFVDGFVTDEPDLTDEMYERADMHNENGAWQMIFGVNTIPSYRRHGLAGKLIARAIGDAKTQGRSGLVLTCKEKLLPYYSKFGFVNEGVTAKSVHGGVTWYQMRLRF